MCRHMQYHENYKCFIISLKTMYSQRNGWYFLINKHKEEDGETSIETNGMHVENHFWSNTTNQIKNTYTIL